MKRKSLIIQPNISEKSYEGSERGIYTFRVARESTKSGIKSEIERRFKVKVEKVRILNRRGKKITDWRRRATSYRKDYKHAMVTLKPGDTIDIFKA